MQEEISTVYIGGGTPSVLPPWLFRRMVRGLSGIFDLGRVKEFTTEANPGTVTREWLDSAFDLGVNRLSIGMQAAQDGILRLLGRIHCMDDVIRSVSLAHEAGFGNISLDLIFGIPYQKPEDWLETLSTALSLRPKHISAYGLIPEEGTPLYHDLETGKLILPEPEVERAMYEHAVRLLAKNGFHRYEISNFALDGCECIHNIGYWTQEPYLGLGVSAASMTGISFGSGGMSYHRRTNPDNFEAYRKTVLSGNVHDAEYIGPAEARFETMMLGLRMNRGVSEQKFFRMHRVSVGDCYGNRMKSLEERGLLLHENGYWRMTDRGFDIQNSVLVELMD